MEKAIYIQAAKAGYKLPVGCSQWWGNPDLPKELEYPTYVQSDGKAKEYNFVCQINLEEVAFRNPTTRLPHKGLLSFFAKIGHYLGENVGDDFVQDHISSPNDVKVLYFPETSNLEEVALINNEGREASPKEMRMTFSEEKEPYAEEHGLFVAPSHRQWETWAPPYERWQILFQVDSFDGDQLQLSFMNKGVLDFLISPEDLDNLDFSKVRAIVLSDNLP